MLAELDKYSTDSYPAPANFMEDLFNEKKESYFDTHMKAALGDFYPMIGTMQWMMQNRRLDQRIYTRLPYELVIR